jgi:AraC-like DNA-binding protein
MEYHEYEPAEALRATVRCYWSLSMDDVAIDPPPEPALPDGSPELILNAADPFVATAPDGTRTVQPTAILVGQITRPFVVGPSGHVDLFAVRFHADGAALLCDDLAPLTDRWLEVDALPVPGLSTLRDVIERSPDAQSRCDAVDTFLARVVAGRPAPDRLVRSAVRAIEDSHGTLALEELAATLGCSIRHLQRQFSRRVGISPKLLARIRRFQRVFSAWREDPRSLSRVAAECGYFDQPHLIRDFRDFAGQAPAAFLANQPEFTQFFLPTGQRPRP